VLLPLATAVFHPGKVAALFGVLPQMSRRVVGVKKSKESSGACSWMIYLPVGVAGHSLIGLLIIYPPPQPHRLDQMKLDFQFWS
jgi:hypothetical protein